MRPGGALPEDRSSVPSTSTRQLTTACNFRSWDQRLWTLQTPATHANLPSPITRKKKEKYLIHHNNSIGQIATLLLWKKREEKQGREINFRVRCSVQVVLPTAMFYKQTATFCMPFLVTKMSKPHCILYCGSFCQVLFLS